MTLTPRVTKVFLVIAIAIVLGLIGVYEFINVGVVPLPASIARIAHGNADLQEAITNARQKLPAFKYRLEHPKAGDHFAIKGQFQTDQGPEFIWLKDPIVSKDGYSAVVAVQPIAAKVQKGQLVDVPDKDVVDFLIQQADGSVTGGYTDAALGSPAY